MNLDGQPCACSIESATLGETLDSRHGDMTMAQLGPRIMFCSLHAAAPALREALQQALEALQDALELHAKATGRSGPLVLGYRTVQQRGKAALKLAEGRA